MMGKRPLGDTVRILKEELHHGVFLHVVAWPLSPTVSSFWLNLDLCNSHRSGQPQEYSPSKSFTIQEQDVEHTGRT